MPCCYTEHGMELFASIERVLWALSLAAEAFLMLRLYSQRLIRRYPFFTIYIGMELLAGCLLIHQGVHGRTYAERFSTYTFAILVARVVVAAELYERICEHFPGIGNFRFGLAGVLVLISAAAAVCVFRPDLAAQWMFPHTVAMVARRFQGEIFAAVFLSMWIFFRYVLSVQQPFRPNVLNHWRIATIYFGISGATSLALLASGGGAAVHPINSAMLAGDIACFLAWIRLMQRSGEQLPWFQRLSPSEIEAVEQHHQDLMETVTSLPRAISDRLTEN
jgi:hypothetical protein